MFLTSHKRFKYNETPTIPRTSASLTRSLDKLLSKSSVSSKFTTKVEVEAEFEAYLRHRPSQMDKRPEPIKPQGINIIEAAYHQRWERQLSGPSRIIYHAEMNRYIGVNSYLMSKRSGRGIQDVTKMVQLEKKRGKDVPVDTPKQSFIHSVLQGELGRTGGRIGRVSERMVEAGLDWKLGLSYKRGSGDTQDMKFIGSKVATLYTTKDDTYNSAGNFLMCELGGESNSTASVDGDDLMLDDDISGATLKSVWMDGCHSALRLMKDQKYDIDGFSHTFVDKNGDVKNASAVEMVVSSDQRKVCTVAYNDGHAKIWSLDDKIEDPVSVLIKDDGLCKFRRLSRVGLAGVSIYNDLLSIASYDGGVYIMNINDSLTSSILREPKESLHQRTPTQITFKEKAIFVGYEQTSLKDTNGELKKWGLTNNKVPEAVFKVGMNGVGGFDLDKWLEKIVVFTDGSGDLGEVDQWGDGLLRIFDARGRTQNPLTKIDTKMNDIAAAGYSPCSRYIACVGDSRSSDKSEILVYDVRSTGKVLHSLKHGKFRADEENYGVTSLVWHPNGGSDTTVRVWDPDRSDPLRQTLQGHDGAITRMAVSEDGLQLAAGSSTSRVYVWTLGDVLGLRDRVKGGLAGIEF